ncbi:hypothetical protein ACQF0C_002121 [Serratia marcescens]
MPFVLLLDNDFIRFTRYRPSDEKVYRKKQKAYGAMKREKPRYFRHCRRRKKN